MAPKPAKKPKTLSKTSSVYVGVRENEHGMITTFAVANSLDGIDLSEKQEEESQKHADEPEPVPVDGFDHLIGNFINSLNALRTGAEILQGSFPLLASALIKYGPEEYCKKHGVKIDVKDGAVYQLPLDKYPAMEDSGEMFRHMKGFMAIQPRLYLIGLVSLYDGYLSNLIELLFKQYPSMLDTSDKTMRYKDVVELGGLQQAANFIIKKEVEAVIRDSHTAHFDWLSSKLGIKLTEGLECWPEFVEVCERRNLFTHANGIVSDQYVKNCEAVGVKLGKKVKPGTPLDISRKYLMESVDTFYEVGVKLGHIIWRKTKKDEIDDADKSFSHAGYELIIRKRYKLAQRVLEFASGMPKVRDLTMKMMKVNLANAYKLDGVLDKAEAILSKIDWSASGLQFQISVAAVLDKFDEAASLMLRIGKDGSVKKNDYHEWPVFIEFRKTEQFKGTYKKIFGAPFEMNEVALREELGISLAPTETEKPKTALH